MASCGKILGFLGANLLFLNLCSTVVGWGWIIIQKWQTQAGTHKRFPEDFSREGTGGTQENTRKKKKVLLERGLVSWHLVYKNATGLSPSVSWSYSVAGRPQEGRSASKLDSQGPVGTARSINPSISFLRSCSRRPAAAGHTSDTAGSDLSLARSSRRWKRHGCKFLSSSAHRMLFFMARTFDVSYGSFRLQPQIFG